MEPLEVQGAFTLSGWIRVTTPEQLLNAITGELELSPIGEVMIRHKVTTDPNFTLRAGQVVKVNGIPIELKADTPAFTHPDNIPLTK